MCNNYLEAGGGGGGGGGKKKGGGGGNWKIRGGDIGENDNKREGGWM